MNQILETSFQMEQGFPMKTILLANRQRDVGMAFQNDALFDSMSVFDNVAFPLRRRGVVESEIETGWPDFMMLDWLMRRRNTR